MWLWVVIALLGVLVVVFMGSLVVRLLNPPIEPTIEEGGVLKVIQIDVVNASGIAGAGRTTMTFLRERGFDVVELSTLQTRNTRSAVIDRVGDRTAALRVANVLGIADSMVVSDIDSMRFVRASVILGSDAKTLQPFTD